MKESWQWSLLGLGTLILFLCVVAAVCPAQSAGDQVTGFIAFVVWTIQGTWLLSKQEAAEAEEKRMLVS